MPVNGESGGVASGNPAFYSFDIGNIHFISLDSYGKEDNKYFLHDTIGPQVQWLKKDLEANKNKGWVITYWHHPPYSKGTHDSDTDDIMSGVRENLLRILDRYEVDLVLTGHSHVYERSRLMKGHYGKSTTFDKAKYNLSNSSGLFDGAEKDGPYVKESEETKEQFMLFQVPHLMSVNLTMTFHTLPCIIPMTPLQDLHYWKFRKIVLILNGYVLTVLSEISLQ